MCAWAPSCRKTVCWLACGQQPFLLIGQVQEECVRCVQARERYAFGVLSGILFVLTNGGKGKGKSFSTGQHSKRAPLAFGKSGGKPSAATTFNGSRFYCGDAGHKKWQCE